MSNNGFDVEIKSLLDAAYGAALTINSKNGKYSSEQVKMLVTITNLKSVISIILKADESPETHSLNLKQLALGLMGAVDFLSEDFDNV